MCCSTSATSCPPPLSTLTVTALYSSGSCSGSNSTSRTGPITCTTLPMFCLGSFLVFVAMWSLSLESFRPTHDLRQFLRNLSLSSAIERALENGQHVAPRVGRVLHGRAPRAVLGGGGFD